MFTVEMKINGTMIGMLYGHNTGTLTKEGSTVYEYSYWEPRNKVVIDGEMFHRYEDGLELLVAKIMNQVHHKRNQ